LREEAHMIRVKIQALAPFANAVMEAAADMGVSVLLISLRGSRERRCIAVAVDNYGQMLALGVRVGERSLRDTAIFTAKARADPSLTHADALKLYPYWPDMEGVETARAEP
jgi:hypothetical protein